MKKTKFIYKHIHSLIVLLVISVSSLFVFDLSNTVIYSPINTNNSSEATENLDYYKYAKVDPLYPVKILRKTGNDRKKINFLFLGDNYAENADPNAFADFIYPKVVLPWLSSSSKKSSSTIRYPWIPRARVPYQTFLNDKFNIYSIQPNYKIESSPSSQESFFGMTTSRFISTPDFGVTKLRVLSYDLSKNFLEDGGIIKPNWIGMVRNGGVGRANSSPSTGQYNTTTSDWWLTHVHEQGHSIYGLSDEYVENMPTNSPNSIYLTGVKDDLSNAKDYLSNIPWREFLGFRGITLEENTKFHNWYVPSYSCDMRSLSHYQDFCEVCTHEMIKRGAKITQEELFYIADPQLTPQENRPIWNKKFSSDNTYSRASLEQMELYSYNINTASNKHLDFRTVVDNLTPKTKRIKAKILITNSSGKSKFSEDSDIYTIQPRELKGITFQTKKKVLGELVNDQDKIIGEIIDVDTNEVLATSLDRINAYNQQYKKNEENIGKELYKVTINFIDKSTNKPLADVKPTILIKRDKTKFKLEKILFDGYKLDSSLSKINNQELMINGQDKEFNYYYDKLRSKKLKLKLIDPSKNNQTIQQKEATVYEGQTFVPSDSDFFLYDLKNLNNKNPNYNAEWKQSVIYPKINYDYNKINDDSELIYSVSDKIPYYTLGNNFEINQGNNIESIKNDFDHFVEYNYTFNQQHNNKNIIWNEVDTSTPGYYKLYFFHDYNEINRKNKLSDPFAFQIINVKVKKIDSYIPDQLEAEINRINSLMLWMKNFEEDRGTLKDFESLNKDNLLDNLSNFNFNKTKFNYEVVNFQKNDWGSTGNSKEIKFNIKVLDKKSKKIKESKLFDKYIYLNDDPLIPKKDLIDLDNEIIKLNSKNILLNKTTFTKDEINVINELNFVNYINWSDIAIDSNRKDYSITNFDKENNIFTFQIQIKLKNYSMSQKTKMFILNYSINNSEKDNELNIEKERIDGLTLSLNKISFTNDELNSLVKNPNSLSNYLDDWNPISGFLYKFEITNNLENKQLNLVIEISKSNDIDNKVLSKIFVFNYSLENEGSKPDQPIMPKNPVNKEDNSNNTLLISLSVSIPLIIIVASIIAFSIRRKTRK
ncbi:hypothetical protein [Mycoplasmoides pirum]|uniref:hypothetical protein n=1 Tax=Mycoplasmoides pirum TaxID=2122 RepID=UPI0012DDF7A8|nr:hypothetical protein [Mycoplasmoides pirum]